MKRLIYDNQVSPDWLVVTKTPLQLAAPFQWDARNTGQRPGVRLGRKRKGPRPLPFEVTILADSDTDLRRKAEATATMFHSEEPKKLQISDEPGRYYMAVWDDNQDFDKLLRHGEGVLNFLSPSPYKYGSEQEKTLVSGNTFFVEGNEKTAPIVEVLFTGNSTNYKIENEKGKFVRVIRNFQNLDKLVIDFDKEYVTLNGNSLMPAVDFSSTFPVLNPGNNKWTVTGSNQTTKIKFAEHWQ